MRSRIKACELCSETGGSKSLPARPLLKKCSAFVRGRNCNLWLVACGLWLARDCQLLTADCRPVRILRTAAFLVVHRLSFIVFRRVEDHDDVRLRRCRAFGSQAIRFYRALVEPERRDRRVGRSDLLVRRKFFHSKRGRSLSDPAGSVAVAKSQAARTRKGPTGRASVGSRLKQSRAEPD